jgi:adenine-specific DNA-methyltransferase
MSVAAKPQAQVGFDAQGYPRLRFMGSKYRLLPYLGEVLSQLEFDTALDAFSGSGVVSYALKRSGHPVTANDFLHFSAAVARATVENRSAMLDEADVSLVTGPPADDRDFIRRTFAGVYFPEDDHRFLDSAWSHIDLMEGHKRDVAIAGLCLAAARKQPRGVFTVTDLRYDDGRRQLRLPLRDLFREAVAEYNAVVFDSGQTCRVMCGDVFALDPRGYDLVYLDPPYAPPRDDNCYIKRYHFLEGLSVYWRGQEIMQHTASRKLKKRFTPFSYKHTVSGALAELFDRFRDSTIVLSYGSNSVPSADEIHGLLRQVKPTVRVHEIDHRYSFGTHAAAKRRSAQEYVFVAR